MGKKRKARTPIVSLQDGAHRRTGVHGRKVKMLARLLSRAARSSQKNVSFLGCVANNTTTTHVATANLTYVSNSPTPTSLVNGTSSWSWPIQNQFQARSYSEDAFAGDTDLIPPVKMYGTSAKYASALWAAATKAKVLDNVGKELEQVIELKSSDAKFSSFLDDPTVPVDKKIEGLKKMFETGKFTEITKNFFFVMAENGRLAELPTVAEQYQELVYASRGEVLVTVTSAIPLSPEQEAECKKVLTEKVLQKGEKLVLNVKVDRKILGGLIFDIGEKHIDMSIEARIRKIENLLRDAVGSV